MMQTLRKKIKYVLGVSLAAFLLLIFFQWGANITGTKDERRTEIAKIDGTPVSYSQYFGFVQQKEQEHKGITRDDVWNLLIEEIMWHKLITKEKIHVTDDELWAIIRNNPPAEIYQSEYMQNENGEFDFNKYYELLRAPQSRMWLYEYERNLRKQIPREKLRSLISTFGWVSPFEDSFAVVAQTVIYDVTYIQLPLFRARSLFEISDAELEEYYNDNPEEFTIKELKILKYVFFERIPSSYDTLEAREQIEDFIERVKEGEDFIELAMEVSDDTSIVVEFEGEEGLNPYLKDIYKKLKNDEMSDVIQTAQGFEVIKRVGRGKIYSARVNVKVSETTKGEIYDRLLSFKEAAKEYGFDSAAVDYDIPVRQTSPMSKENVTFPVRNPEGLSKFLAKAHKDEISGPFGSYSGYFLFTVDSIIPEILPEFEEIKPRVRVMIERGKMREAVEQRLSQVYNQLMSGNTIEQVAIQETLVVVRDMTDVVLDQLRSMFGGEFAGVTAALESGQISSPLITDWAGYIVRCDKKETTPFDSTMIMSLQVKRQTRLQEISRRIFTPKKIEDYRDEFFE